jgi:hypothetical protein
LTSNDEKLFERWYEAPLKKLEEVLPNGDGGFVVLAVSCFLYERYATAVIVERKGKATTEVLIENLAKDFNIENETARVFWDVIRNGFLHGAMPKVMEKGTPIIKGWQASIDFQTPISFKDGMLKIQPWKFRDHVLQLWKENPNLISTSKSFPWAKIWG